MGIFLYSYVYILCVYSSLRSQRVLYPLGLKLQMVASCHVGAGTQIWVLWKSRQQSFLLSHLSNQSGFVFKGLFCYFFYICAYVCMHCMYVCPYAGMSQKRVSDCL